MVVPDFAMTRRPGDGAGFTGRYWKAEWELDTHDVPSEDSLKIARDRMPPGCAADTVNQVAKGWKPIFRSSKSAQLPVHIFTSNIIQHHPGVGYALWPNHWGHSTDELPSP